MMYVENCNINLKCFIFLDLSIMDLGLMYVENCNINLKCFIFLDLSIMDLGRRGSLFKMFCSMRWSLRAVSPPLPLLVLVVRSPPPLVSSSSSNSRTWRWTHLGRIQGTACFGTHPCPTKPISMNIHNIPSTGGVSWLEPATSRLGASIVITSNNQGKLASSLASLRLSFIQMYLTHLIFTIMVFPWHNFNGMYIINH